MPKHHHGIHHITAIAGDPQQNINFYSGVLGLRLIKKTVNFDDPSVYHFYYGDEKGNPGTILTFFPWKHAVQGKPDRGQVVAVAFAIPPDALGFWEEHFDKNDVDYLEPFTRFGREVIGFRDPDGLHLELVTDDREPEAPIRPVAHIPEEYAIRGIYGATIAEEDYRTAGDLLVEELGFEEKDRHDDRRLFTTNAKFGSVIEIIDGADLDGRPGKGTVHHIAFRTEEDEKRETIRQKLLNKGYHVTDVKDRQYYKSIYFHEAGGTLFEVATDVPGFTIDEAPEQLGRDLKLPPWLEDRRDLIEAGLPEIEVPV